MADELLGRNQAARYCNMDTRKFSRRVKNGEIDEEEPKRRKSAPDRGRPTSKYLRMPGSCSSWLIVRRVAALTPAY